MNRTLITEPVNQERILHLQQFPEDGLLFEVKSSVIALKKTRQNAVQLPRTASTSIKDLTLFLRKTLFSTFCAQGYFLSCIACLICAIDLAGLSPFGQVLVQFMMV